ncbi:GDSL-type esterase/lipase family protein [Sorangium sp. So ce134]
MKPRNSISLILTTIACLGASTLFTPDAQADCLIEPFGDSITAGYSSTAFNTPPPGVFYRGAGYRYHMWLTPPVEDLAFVGGRDDAAAAPILLDMAAGAWDGRYHSGVNGWRVDQLSLQVSSGYTLNPGASAHPAHPDIILVHAGTNDFIQGADASSVAARLISLLVNLHVKHPNAKILVAQIIPFDPSVVANAPTNLAIQAYNAAIPGILTNLNGTNNVYSAVDMYSELIQTYTPLTWYFQDLYTDSWHPNDAGYRRMASKWSAAIKTIASAAGCTATP